MARRSMYLLCSLAAIAASGCRQSHRRPASVPAPAVWVDHAFVDCSEAPKFHADRCTIYSESNGTILADGLFADNVAGGLVAKSDLRYITRSDDSQSIYLENSHQLRLCYPSGRDPSQSLVAAKLVELSSRAGVAAIDCTGKASQATYADETTCALTAFKAHKAFYVHYYREPIDSSEFVFGVRPGADGYAADAAGNGWAVSYKSTGWQLGAWAMREQLFANGKLLVSSCPAPADFYKGLYGELECFKPLRRPSTD